MREAFGWDLDRLVFFGGYPGAATLVHDEPRWRAYILDSLIETTISRDILLHTRIEKPALETAVGAHLVAGDADVYYWRERNAEVDLVTQTARAHGVRGHERAPEGLGSRPRRVSHSASEGQTRARRRSGRTARRITGLAA